MKKLFTLLFLFILTASSFGQVVVTDDITSNTSWSASNEYHLNGLIFVHEGATLTIEAGTVIKGLSSTNITSGDGASALIVRRGAKIMAEGTASMPIIFTTEFDDVNDPTDLGSADKGLWGGLILLGKATTNQPTTDNQIEGIPPEEDALYGGTDDTDNSGVLRYISIRHGGFSISGVEGDEINGLTMGAIGSGTTIEFIEVFANFDDGYEWFGGAVNTSNLVAAFCGDDCFDYDQGFRGNHQFWFSLQGTDEAGRAGEHDGGDDNETGTPYALPNLANATYIGSGVDATPGGDGNDRCLYFRDNAGGFYSNSIFTSFSGYGVKIEDLENDVNDSRGQMEAGSLILKNNYWFDFGNGNTIEAMGDNEDYVVNHLSANGNQAVDPMLRGISREMDGNLDPRLQMSSPAYSAAVALEGSFFDAVSYCGAFDPNASLWTDGWTALYSLGYTGDLPAGEMGVVVVTDDITSNTSWSSSNEYHLNGLIFVHEGATLTIQPGTVIKGLSQANITSGDGASALIVRRGAKIMAEGTASMPIIFTTEFDDVNDPTDLGSADKGLWGGLILLGKATTNQPTTDNQIEGIPPEEDALYGGTDDTDNSGVLRYISIRHGGFSISGVEGDEINGLTMGAIGSGTTIEFIEVFANFDDGYEWFGGAVNTSNLVAAFCGDDCFDYDQGFRGNHQFWFSLQGTDEAGRAGEHDGGDDNETGTPYALPNLANATYIGSGVDATPGGDGNDRCLYFRDNAGGFYSNSIFTSFSGYGVKIEDLENDVNDSRGQMEAGSLILKNNYWFDFGNGNTIEAMGDNEDYVVNHLSANGNQAVDPMLRGISREMDNILDPRPTEGSPAASGATALTGVTYSGAFDPNAALWTDGWTALYSLNYTDRTPVSVEEISGTVPTAYELSQNYPNPFNPTTTINFSIPEASNVQVAVYNTLGQEVAVLVNGYKTAGNYKVTFDARNMASGMYIYKLQSNKFEVFKKMLLLK
ncbi:MAG: T9SS type A sorting domain-containing protein [Melioribacteraceae bacterium]|nr:T9SS type A sorting domain-containing protein [Melioribacteraceae bacterium]